MEKHDYYWMRLCTLAIIPFFVLIGIFWGILGMNIPPFSGAVPKEDLAALVTEHAARFRIAYAVAVPSWAMLMLWSIGLYGIMRRMEGSHSLLPIIQLVGGALTVLVPSMASVFWLAAAYRPEASPEIIRLLYDLGWLTIDMVFAVTTIQYIAAAIAMLKDKRAIPLFPRWLAWVGIWIGVEFLAEIIMPNFRSGPFSWSGLFNYWIPFFGPFAWMAIMSIYMVKAIARLQADDAATSA